MPIGDTIGNTVNRGVQTVRNAGRTVERGAQTVRNTTATVVDTVSDTVGRGVREVGIYTEAAGEVAGEYINDARNTRVGREVEIYAGAVREVAGDYADYVADSRVGRGFRDGMNYTSNMTRNVYRTIGGGISRIFGN